MPFSLVGQRVRLRALEERDLDPIWQAYQDFDLELITSGDSPPVSDIQVKAFWRDIMTDPGAELRYFAIEPLPGDRNAGGLVGSCSLQHIDLRNRRAELGIWLASRQARGLGYGQDAIRLLLNYAFEVVNLEKVYLGVYDFNEGGLRAYERVGLRYEGRLRHMLYYEGRWWDEWPMRMLRAEWEMIRQPSADGLRPYHPADYETALMLIQQHLNAPDKEAARSILRRWWRSLDRNLYGYQVDGSLAGLVSLAADAEPPGILDMIAPGELKGVIERVIG